MNIGILKEQKQDERRVALRPDQAAALIAQGHRVLIERMTSPFDHVVDHLLRMPSKGLTL
jgi:alanine dehydrogenase